MSIYPNGDLSEAHEIIKNLIIALADTRVDDKYARYANLTFRAVEFLEKTPSEPRGAFKDDICLEELLDDAKIAQGKALTVLEVLEGAVNYAQNAFHASLEVCRGIEGRLEKPAGEKEYRAPIKRDEPPTKREKNDDADDIIDAAEEAKGDIEDIINELIKNAHNAVGEMNRVLLDLENS